MKLLPEKFKSLLTRPVLVTQMDLLRRAGGLFASRAGAMIVGLPIAALSTHALAAEQYGRVALVMSTISNIAVFFTVGLDSAPRMLALATDQTEQRHLAGAFLSLASLLGLALGAVLWHLSPLLDSLVGSSIGSMLRIVAPLSWILTVQTYTEWLAVGMQRTSLLGAMTLFSRLAQLGLIIAVILSQQPTPTQFALIAMVTAGIGPLLFIFTVRPTVSNFLPTARQILSDIRGYGLHAYAGRIPAVFTYGLDKVLVGKFGGASDVGLLVLAQTFATPVLLLAESLGQASYRTIAQSALVHPDKIRLALISASIAGLGMICVGTACILLCFPLEFRAAIPLLVIASFACALQGIGTLYSNFIATRGAGDIMRRTGWILAGSTLAFNVLLISLLQSLGAVFSAVLINALWVFVLRVYYNSLRKVPRS